MAKKAKKIKTNKGLKLEVVNPNAAGIDVSSTELQVCVPENRDGDNNRCFGVFTCDLHDISAWLIDCRIDTIAMESTGVYRIPLYERLVADGFDVLIGNAKAIKNIAEKKTDEVDAEWIMLLHSYGLLRASFQPCNQATEIRNLVRHRDNLLQSSTKKAQHMQKYMELMNIKLVNVISDIPGKSGRDIISAILKGERDPKALAALAYPRCKASREVIEKSLDANWDENLLFTLKQSYDMYHYIQNQMKDCEMIIEKIIISYQKSLPQKMIHKTTCRRSDKYDIQTKKNSFLRGITCEQTLLPLRVSIAIRRLFAFLYVETARTVSFSDLLFHRYYCGVCRLLQQGENIRGQFQPVCQPLAHRGTYKEEEKERELKMF